MPRPVEGNEPKLLCDGALALGEVETPPVSTEDRIRIYNDITVADLDDGKLKAQSTTKTRSFILNQYGQPITFKGSLAVDGTITSGGYECVTKDDFDAATILVANSDNVPETLSVAVNTLVGRNASDVEALPIAVNTLVGRAGGVLGGLVVATNTVVVRAGGNIEDMFVGTNSVVGRRGGNVTNISLASNAVLGRTGGSMGGIALPFNSLLGRQDGAIIGVTVADSRIVGRMPDGNLDDLTAAQVADTLVVSLKPAFISNRWYNQSPGHEPDVSATGFVLATNSILYYFLEINQTVSFDVLGLFVVTTQAGKNARTAIYNSDSTPQPTTLIVESDPMTVAGAGLVTDPVTETALPPGRYWWAINADSATATVRRISAISSFLHILGAVNAGDEAADSYTEAHVFGAFPATATPIGPGKSSTLPLIRFQVV